MASSQEQLPGFEVDTEEDLNRRVAFGGFVKEHQYDPEGKLAGIELTDTEKRWFTTEQLAGILFQDERNRGRTRGIDPNPVGYAKGVLLPPGEFTWIKRPPELLARSAARRTLNATTEINDEAQARSQRSRAHALETTIGSITVHKNGLIERRHDIAVLLKEATTPGFAHKSAREMKQLIGQSWSELLNVLDTLKIQREWDNETRLRAEAAAVRYLTSKSQNIRVGNWQKLLKLEGNYLNARVGLLRQSTRAHQRELDVTIFPEDDSTIE